MELLEYLKNLPVNKERIELCYLWIKNYKLIDKQGFNFGTKYIFDYDCDNRVINIKQNSNYINNFFGKNIINITAIVGENGAGKSFILGNLNKFLFSSDINHITIFIKNEELIIIDNNKIGAINIKDILTQKNYELKNIEFKECDEYKIKEYLGIIYSIFYSNVFYNSIEKSSASTYQKFSNISTKFLLSFEMNKGNSNQVNKLFQHDMLLMIQFLANNKDKIDTLFLQPVKYLSLYTQNNYEEKIEEVKHSPYIYLNSSVFIEPSLIDDINKLEIQHFATVRDSLLNKLNTIKNNKNKFKITTIINILYDFYKGIESLTDFQVIISKLSNYKFNYTAQINIDILKQDIKNLFNEIIDYIKSNSTKEDLKNKILEIEKYISFIDLLDSLDDIAAYNKDIVTIRLTEEIQPLIKFINEYYYTSKRNYYKFEWIEELGSDRRVLSSGEEAMLKMYSRLYSQLEETYNNTVVKIDKNFKNVLILMDEPEAYLHPEWQRKLINNLINYFKEVYSEFNVQLILTSNTPFLISDLPRENIILLEKDKIKVSKEKTKDSIEENDDCEYKIRVRNDLLERSFGQNIHKLLKESFFMKSTIGEYSKSKIDDLIKDLNSDNEISNDRKEEMEKIINIIGEPIIKNKLLEMFYTKFYKDNNLEKIEREIKRLQLMKESILKKESDSK